MTLNQSLEVLGWFQNFSECQFFEHDIAENGNKYLKECPDSDEKCCFSLREHMSIEFWGRKSATKLPTTMLTNSWCYQTFSEEISKI